MDGNNTIPPNPGNWQPQPPFGDKGNKPSGMKIVGYNLLVFAIYTALCAATADDGGFIFDMFLIGIHVLVGIVLAIANRNWAWLLSALIVLVIGFSTCVGMINFNGH